MSSLKPPLRFLVFSEAKRGHGPGEYEDASAGNAARGRFAIADGATESSYAGIWARMLVDEFVASGTDATENWAAWLPALQAKWEIAVGERPLPWYAEMKRQQGAFATFLGVLIEPPHWRALTVGDSCMFHIRQHSLRTAFPLLHAADFNNSPWLVGSRGFTPEMMATRELRSEGDFANGDRLWLMTDALAQWFLQQAEANQRPWELLEPLLTVSNAANHFSAWLAALRGFAQIRNDDVTLMAIWTAL